MPHISWALKDPLSWLRHLRTSGPPQRTPRAGGPPGPVWFPISWALKDPLSWLRHLRTSGPPQRTPRAGGPPGPERSYSRSFRASLNRLAKPHRYLAKPHSSPPHYPVAKPPALRHTRLIYPESPTPR